VVSPNVIAPIISFEPGSDAGLLCLKDMLLRDAQLIHESRFTRVYRAQIGDRTVLVKRALGDPAVLSREAAVAAEVSHPTIPALIAHDADEHGPRLIREWVEGVTLTDRLASGPLLEPWVEGVLAQLREALQAVHSAGWLHGDLTASNVLVNAAGRVWLIDFGHSQRQSEARPHLIGTIGSMAPELFDGQPASIASDLYALGVIGYQMLTGRLPYDGEHAVQIIAAQHRCPVSPLPESISAGLRAGVMRLLSRAPEQRWF
jgi:eukaryotic-like serine/threonine-protein kinase